MPRRRRAQLDLLALQVRQLRRDRPQLRGQREGDHRLPDRLVPQARLQHALAGLQPLRPHPHQPGRRRGRRRLRPAARPGPLQHTALEVKLIDWDAPSPTGFASGFVGGAGGIPFGPPDPQVAAIMCNVLDRMHVSAKVRLAAWETAIVESGVHNLPYGRPRLPRRLPAAVDAGLGHARADHGPGLRDAQVRLAWPRGSSTATPTPACSRRRSSAPAFPDRYGQRAGQAAALDQKFCG